MLAITSPAHAQETVYRVSNRFIKAHVITVSNSGRFWITAGPQHHDSIRFLFYNSPTFVTSNIVFRIKRGNSIRYYCNQPDNYLVTQGRPTPSTGYATYKPYDTMHVGTDTLFMQWRGLDGFDVTLRIIAEKPQTIYDSGADLLFEFTYALQRYAIPGELGLLLMLDTFNSQGGSNEAGGAGDSPSVLTNTGYLPVNGLNSSTRYTAATMPEWYHIGNFLYRQPLTDIFPIHRLKGRSHGGDSLTPPNMFAVGHWPNLNKVAWDLPSDFGSTSFVDCATILRWEGLVGSGVIRTAFGLSDKQGNQNFTCRDDNIFVDIKAPRLITQAVKNGPYSQSEFDVEMWATNTSEINTVSPRIRLQSPIDTYPSGDRRNPRLILDSAATPADQTIFLGPKQSAKLRWRLKVNPLSTDTLAQLVFYRQYGTAMESRFLEDCNPLITIMGWHEPAPPSDTMNPRIELTGSGRNSSVFWNFNLYDRHPGYAYDTGLRNPIEVLASENVSIVYSDALFPSCDITRTIGMNITVSDTSRPANVTFRARDCAGNDSIATVVYAPRPDPYPPVHIVELESGAYPGAPGCNTRRYEHVFLDNTHQGRDSGDYGFGTIVIADSTNMRIVINGGQPIRPFQGRVTLVADVIDSMSEVGGFKVHAFDFAGNETVVTKGYCTVPDREVPLGVSTPIGTGRYLASISDRRAWDRGLRGILELSNDRGNMQIVSPPVINVGDRSATFEVQAVDLLVDGDVTYEIRDSVGHTGILRIVYTAGTPPPRDTVAPDIDFAKVAGSNGADVIVTIDEEHYFDGLRYPYDTGLDSVRIVSSTANIEVASPIVFFDGDVETKFRIRVIDTLAIGIRDTMVIGAFDRAG
ncbi:MAG: hypothetical protein H7X80_08500, partial [bacterium]|nr:hypothetical protein [Candidatus Kapabacteria bacterium]